jgi:hypothetical protein
MNEEKMLFMEDISATVSTLNDVEKFLAERGAYLNPRFEIETIGNDICVKMSVYFDSQKLRQYNCQCK